MPNKIESTSTGKDAYSRRDFAANTEVDKHGNKTAIDNAGNVRLVANEDWESGTGPDFSYQKKYNLSNSIDKHGNNVVNASVLDDAFIETLANASKGLLDNRMLRVSKALPDGDLNLDTKEEELSEGGIKSLQLLVDAYNQYKDREKPYLYPKNITLKSLVNQETYTEDEKEFIHIVAEELKVTPEQLIRNIKEEVKDYKKLEKIGIICDNCNAKIGKNDNFCSNCGQKRQLCCDNCSAIVTPNVNFCANCGYRLK